MKQNALKKVKGRDLKSSVRKPLNNILIAMPIYNECKHVEDVLSAVSEFNQNIVVINDGSSDGTEKLLERFTSIKIITHSINQGYGQCLIDAFNYAKKHNYEWVITIDCDHQHQPSHLPLFFEKIKQGNVDIISGSRYLKTHNQGSMKPPLERVAINKKITTLLNQTLGLKLTDSFCGFKAYRVDSLKHLHLTEKGYGMPLQLWIQAALTNLKICELAVPLIYHDPNRNFAGLLESPDLRLQYYMDIIQRELSLYDYKNTKKVDCSA